jgi:hypothetical protein
MPGDLAEKFDMAKSSTTTCWRSSGISQFSIHGFSQLINSEVVVIDGGEWLKVLVNLICWSIPEELWDQLEMMIKAKKNK